MSEIYSYSISIDIPQTADFDNIHNTLLVVYPSIVYTRYRHNDTLFDIISSQVISNTEDICTLIIDTYQNETQNALWSALRNERNKRLSECDWTQLPDSPLNSTIKLIWASYRQNLRDLPGNTSNPSSPEWPTIPQST
jgi:Phage tail assembly chaperone protein